MSFAIFAKVKPNAKKFKISVLENSENKEPRISLNIEIPEKPERGKANLYLIKFFSKISIDAKILKGAQSQKKLIEFCNVSEQELVKKLGPYLE